MGRDAGDGGAATDPADCGFAAAIAVGRTKHQHVIAAANQGADFFAEDLFIAGHRVITGEGLVGAEHDDDQCGLQVRQLHRQHIGTYAAEQVHACTDYAEIGIYNAACAPVGAP